MALPAQAPKPDYVCPAFVSSSYLRVLLYRAQILPGMPLECNRFVRAARRSWPFRRSVAARPVTTLQRGHPRRGDVRSATSLGRARSGARGGTAASPASRGDGTARVAPPPRRTTFVFPYVQSLQGFGASLRDMASSMWRFRCLGSVDTGRSSLLSHQTNPFHFSYSQRLKLGRGEFDLFDLSWEVPYA